MEKEKKKTNRSIIIVAIIVIFTSLWIAGVGYAVIVNNSRDEKESNKVDKKEEDIKEDVTDSDIKSDEGKTNNNSENNKVDLGNEVDNNISDNPNEKLTEAEFVNYMVQQEKDLNQNTTSEKAKKIFITTVDFLFYNGTIKGYTFSELSDSAKLQILKIALSIDNKIEQYFPEYKENISSTYTNIKAKIIEAYLDLTVKVCDVVGSETCNQAKEDFQSLKNSFSITWEFIKDIGVSVITKLDEWYKIYSGK